LTLLRLITLLWLVVQEVAAALVAVVVRAVLELQRHLASPQEQLTRLL
jgi:hypothetical protein